MVYRTAERWSSRVSVIMAVAGSAVGLGNFLRFPTLAATYGGGILIPYFCALLLLGLPLMWMEWALGRYGGIWGRHNLSGIYDQVTHRSWGKYLGVLALYLPFIIVVYYLYVESWTLGYTFFSALDRFNVERGTSEALFNGFTGASTASFLARPDVLLLIFTVITLLINFYVVYRGAEAGIDKANMIAMPLLFVVTAFLIFKIFTRPGIDLALDHLWRPEMLWQRGNSYLLDPNIWLKAAGQVLFTLSLAVGAVITYTSYLRKEDDVALGGLTAVSMNTFAELILGASIVVPVAILMLGGMTEVGAAVAGAKDAYTLPFLALPKLFSSISYGNQIGALWFLLLFFAGITSSVSLLQPILAFFQDELGWSRARGTVVLFLLTAAYLVPVIWLQNHGFFNEMDFWAVTLLLPVGALIEVLVFLSVLGMSRGWEGITAGALIRVPRFFQFIIKYVMTSK